MAVSAGEGQYVTFALDREVFAVPVALVREILDFRQAFRIPNGPDYLLGLTDVRGHGVPTIDLRVRLGLAKTEPTPHTRILVINATIDGRELTLGLVADRVFEVSTFAHSQMEAAPDIGVSWSSSYIAGVVRRQTDFVVLLDISRLFSGGSMASRSWTEERSTITATQVT
jgi:purine-binding chemotaxis protein CheW